MCIGGPVIERNGASSKTVGNSAMMDAFRMVTSESGSAALEDGAGVAPSGGWGAVGRAAAWSREWGQPSSRRPRLQLMQEDWLSNDTFNWLYTWSLVSHERPCRCRVAGMVPRDWSTAWWCGAKFLSRLGSTVARSLALMASMSAPLSGSQRVSPTLVLSIWVWMATRWSAVRCA